jgi:DNA repair ATPase RecN
MEAPGLAYRKIDLHVHTPASKCFEDSSVTAEDIVKKAREEGLDAIAITDHNTAEWIDKVKEASKGRLVVFPGIEISATGGKNGIHIIGIFEQSKTTKDIENLLGALDIKANMYGKEEAFTKFSPSQVIDKIAEHGGFPILAHANSSHGVMNDMTGNQRVDIIRNKRLIAAEATDIEDRDKKENGKRVIDFLNGKDQCYKQKLAVYQASDSHSLYQIGSRYTYFKLEEISFEGLRQCFCDPDVRIKQKNELETKKFPKIVSMKVSQGFLKNQEVCFHEGLNCIIGGKGVGKSLVIEFLRFAIDQPSRDESILRDYKEKLEKRLELLGTVAVEFELEGGDRYQIMRKYDRINDEVQCINLSTNETYDGKLSDLFPVLAYSQNEIIKIAEDEQAQLRLIDLFIDSSSFERDIQRLSQQLEQKDRELAKSINASSVVASYQKELNAVKEQLQNINRSLENVLFDEIKLWEKKKVTIDRFFSSHNDLIAHIEQLIFDFANEMMEYSANDKLSDDPLIKKAENLYHDSYSKILNLMGDAKNSVIQNKGELSKISDEFGSRFKKKQEEYEEMLRQAGGDERELESKRRELLGKKQEVEQEMEEYARDSKKLDEIKNRRNELLDQLDEVYNAYYEARKQEYDNLTAQSNGKLRLELSHAVYREKFKDELLSLRKGSRIREADIERISQNLMPRELIDLVIDNDVDSLAEKADIAKENAKKLIDILNSLEALEDVLALSHKAYPGDTPSIKFRKEDSDYYTLRELSVGQKCTALLIIALSEGTRPIIIDQPEDSLDIPSVYEDVVSKLRSGKERRQFILTTHNSSVGVASDSDVFIILRSTATQGNIECYGAIDRKEVRSEVIKHLEGGQDPYELKKRKYNI